MNKRKYHTDLILQYKLGLLESSVSKVIPSSTLHYWRKTNYSNLIGAQYSCLDNGTNLAIVKLIVNHNKLRRITKGLYYLMQGFLSINDKVQFINQSVKQEIAKSIEICSPYLGLTRCLKLWQVSNSQFYYWKSLAVCHKSLFSKCLKIHPNQLTNNEISTIRNYLRAEGYANWSAASIYHKIIRDNAAYFSKATFYKYLNQLGIIRMKLTKPKQKDGLKASFPFEYLHMDVTQFKLPNNQTAHIYVLIDNYSRKILSLTASLQYSSKMCFENLKKGIGEVNTDHNIKIVSDGGPENFGFISKFIQQSFIIRRFIALKQIGFSNSMVESVNKKLKYEYLYHMTIDSIETLIKKLPLIKEDYNHRPFDALAGLTPNEAASGIKNNMKNLRLLMQEAKKNRIIVNKKNRCKTCLTTPTR